MFGPLKLNATWNLDPLPATDQESVAYVLVDISEEGATSLPAGEQAQNPQPAGENPLNLSLVLDTSGSMAGAKLQNVKQAVRWVVEHLSPQDAIAITHFDDEVHSLIPSTRVADATGLVERVDAIREAGGTAMSKGLLVGLDEAMKGRAANLAAVSRIIVLTDGQTWGDTDRCKELATQAGAAGIPITALGVGADEDWSIELLDDLATESGGLSGYIAKPEEISAAFQGTVLAMQQTVARNLRVTVNPSRGVAVRALYRVAPLIAKLWPGQGAGEASTPEDGALTLPLGDMQSGTTQTLLLELLLPPRKPGQFRLARLALKYEPTDRPHAEAEETLDLAATFATGVARGPGNPRVMNSVEKATAFRLQTRALQASMVGDVAGATRNLRAAATRLLNMGETDLAEEAEKQAQLLESKGQMTPAGTKKLAYETRMLAVSEAEGVGETAPAPQEPAQVEAATVAAEPVPDTAGSEQSQ